MISLDNRFNVGSYDSADLISRFSMKYSGLGACRNHVGSLLRPPELFEARAAPGRPRSRRGIARVEDDAIRDVVRMQQEIGLKAITDGEFRRTFWHIDFLYQIERGGRPTRPRIQFRNEAGPV